MGMVVANVKSWPTVGVHYSFIQLVSNPINLTKKGVLTNRASVDCADKCPRPMIVARVIAYNSQYSYRCIHDISYRFGAREGQRIYSGKKGRSKQGLS